MRFEVRYREKSIYDVLENDGGRCDRLLRRGEENATCKRIIERLRPLQEVGLGYIRLGQSSSTLSGGESQRVMLASFLSKESTEGNVMFIFDEPTGLHFHDISKLLDAFNALIARGATIVIVEHNMDVIKCADWVVDLGPGTAGDRGGSIVFEGTPGQIFGCRAEESYTGRKNSSARETNKTTMEFTTYTLPTASGAFTVGSKVTSRTAPCW